MKCFPEVIEREKIIVEFFTVQYFFLLMEKGRIGVDTKDLFSFLFHHHFNLILPQKSITIPKKSAHMKKGHSSNL